VRFLVPWRPPVRRRRRERTLVSSPVAHLTGDQYVERLSEALGVPVYDGVEAAREAGLLPPEQR